MRVALNAHYLRRKLSGLGRYSRQVAAALESSGVSILEIAVPEVFYSKQGRVWQLLRFITLTAVELIEPCVLLLLGRCTRHVSPAFSVPICLHSRRSIVVVHDLAFVDYADCYTRLERWYFAFNLRLLKWGSHRIVVPSKCVRDRLCSELGFALERVTVISPYSDFERTDRAPTSSGKYFLLLSNAHPRKNIEATVAGFEASRAPKQGYELVLVGNAERTIQARTSIKVLGGVSNEQLKVLFEQAEAVLLFSLSEGFGYPVVEAASLGVPALTSETSSLAEFVVGDRPPSPALTSKQIADRIDMYLSDESYRAALRVDIERINRVYSREAFTRRWRELIYAE